jgi:hypothetical protein
MARRRWVIRDGQLVELNLDAPPPPRRGPYIMSDIREYRSAITAEVISSRSMHRAHLRAHGCIEVGNEMPRVSREAPPPVRADAMAALEASPERHAEARAASERAGKAEI